MAESFLKQLLLSTHGTQEVKSMMTLLFHKVEQKILIEMKRKYFKLAMNQGNPLKQSKKTVISNQHLKQTRAASEEPAETHRKEEEIRVFLQKVKSERLERVKRQQDREEKQRQKQMIEERYFQRLKEEDLQRKEEKKIKQLSEMRSKSLQRKREIQDLIDFGNFEYKKVTTSKPLYEKIEEEYFKRVLAPELQRHKFELARKRELFQPIDRSAILQHARKHDLLMEEHEIQKLSISHDSCYDPAKLRSKFTLAYIEEQKRCKIMKERGFIDKKVLADKKKHYANLVLQMYTPTVDPAKKIELEMIRERLEGGDLVKKKSVRSLEARENHSDNERSKKRKWKPNLMIPPQTVKREPVKVDWLAQQRQVKKNHFLSEKLLGDEWDKDTSVDLIKKKVWEMEEEVRKKEIKIQILNPGVLKGVKESQAIGDLLINSIKGKLAILDKDNEI